MKNEDAIQDWRSTGRRKARLELFKSYEEYKCVDCGKTTVEPPKDAPTWFEEIWPEQNRILLSQLQADHETKDLTQNSVEFLNWRCPSCHKLQDNKTEKGEATVTEKLF